MTQGASPFLLLDETKSFGWKRLIRSGRSYGHERLQLLHLSSIGLSTWGFNASSTMVLGAGLETACLSAYAPQTYVSDIHRPERLWKLGEDRWETQSRQSFWRTRVT